jgi:hypothetical protein
MSLDVLRNDAIAADADPSTSGRIFGLGDHPMADILPSYPPSLPPDALNLLTTSLNDYCLSHGITVRPVQSSERDHLASHAPVTLFPSLFPRNAWEQALKVQTAYNLVYARIANDVDWLGQIMNEYVAFAIVYVRLVDVDDFVRQLWEVYQEVKNEGIVQVHAMERILS